MPNACDLPVIVTGGTRSPAMLAHQRAPLRRLLPGFLPCPAPTGDRGSPQPPGEVPARPDGAAAHGSAHPAGDGRPTAERGSQTTEYALILIVAATIALVALTWAREGAVESILDAVVGQVLDLFGIGGG